MSNREELDTDRKTSDPSAPKTWQQKYGAMLLLAGFGALIVVMVVMQKSMQSRSCGWPGRSSGPPLDLRRRDCPESADQRQSRRRHHAPRFEPH